MSFTITRPSACSSSDEEAVKVKEDDRSGACRSAPAAAAHCRTSVPLDRRYPSRWSINFVRTGGNYNAASNGARPLPAGVRPAASGGRRPILKSGAKLGAPSAIAPSTTAFLHLLFLQQLHQVSGHLMVIERAS
jgi:hypothetical protein